MKHFLIILMAVAVLIPVATVRADTLTYEEAWAFLYEFPLAWQDGTVTQAGAYMVTSGEAPVLVSGPWSLVIRNGAQELLNTYEFDPAAMAAGGVITLKVPAEDSGASAAIVDEFGAQTAVFDLRGSRVCDDDAVCESDAGERRENCATDCGAVAQSAGPAQSATIADQLPSGMRVGSIILRLSAAAAAVLMLVAVSQMLDSRKRP